MEEADYLCDRVIIIDAGRIVADGSPAVLAEGHRSLEAAYLDLTTRTSA